MMLSKLISRVLLRLLGWRFVSDGPPAPSVVVGYPHTSYIDSMLMMIMCNIHIGYLAIKGEGGTEEKE